MAMDIINLLKDTKNGLLSKIEIGGKVYELKDLVARENIETLADLVDALSAKVGTVADGENLAALVDALETAVANLGNDKADKTQVAADIKAAVDAEAAIARKAEKDNADAIKANADSITAINEDLGEINAVLNTISDTDDITSLKELAIWVEEHGGEAAEMSKAITANAEAIAKEAKDRADADTAFDGRLADVEALLTGGEGSVGEQIADAKDEAIAAAKEYTDGEIDKLGDLAGKNEADLNLKALAHKDEATGTVAGQTISGVKATGTGVTGVSLSDTANEKDLSAAGKYTPAGNVTGTTVAAGTVAITVTNASANASIQRSDYQPSGSVAVALTGTEFNKITSVGTAAQFTEGEFTAATLDREDVTANYAKEGIVGKVEGETLTFTAAGIEALTATKVNGFTGGSKAADTFVPNTPAAMEAHNVGVQSATFTGDVASELKVETVSYMKHDNATAVFTGEASDISATFAGTEGDIAVAGKYTDTTYAASTTTGTIELAVGDIAVAATDVTVR